MISRGPSDEAGAGGQETLWSRSLADSGTFSEALPHKAFPNVDRHFGGLCCVSRSSVAISPATGPRLIIG